MEYCSTNLFSQFLHTLLVYRSCSTVQVPGLKIIYVGKWWS